jgi:hypothetical protein
MRTSTYSGRAALIVAALTVVAAAGCSTASSAASLAAAVPAAKQTTTSVPGATPSPSLVGPAATNPAPVLASTIQTWTTMTSTLYAHHYVENVSTGVYDFDCVGATSYFLKIAAPNANRALNTAEKIAPGYVPTPSKYASFFASLPPTGTSAWLPLTSPTDLAGGEIIAVPPPSTGTSPNGSAIPGHALVAAGPALALWDGGYAVLVYDSTATPHGTQDTRLTDPRNQPLPPATPGGPTRPSGLGRGTIELRQKPGKQGWFLYWSVGGNYQYGAAVAIARPLS